jgi:hypothetical protein
MSQLVHVTKALKMYDPLHAQMLCLPTGASVEHAKSDAASDTIVEIRHLSGAGMARTPQRVQARSTPTRELEVRLPCSHIQPGGHVGYRAVPGSTS